MPGPKSERNPNATPRESKFTRPNKRAAKRLEIRTRNTPGLRGFAVPGSQNRNK